MTPIGYVPTLDALDLTGLKFDHTKIAAALKVDTAEWIAETRLIDEWYATIGGNTLPDVLREELGALKLRLSAPSLADPLPGKPAATRDADFRRVRVRTRRGKA